LNGEGENRKTNCFLYSLFHPQTQPVLSLSFDPKSRYLASVGCDGKVKIWDLEKTEEEGRRDIKTLPFLSSADEITQ